MSSGPGKHQNAILRILPESGEILFREVLWELALSQGKIEKTSKYGGEIQEGTLNRSFVENTRRAFDGLVESKAISRHDRKIESLTEFICKFEYFTPRLELLNIRRSLKSHIIDFVSKGQYTSNRDIDFEEFQIKQLRNSDKLLYQKLKSDWYELETILLDSLTTNRANIDLFLSILSRGRFLFAGRKKGSNAPLHRLLVILIGLGPGNKQLKHITVCMTALVSTISALGDYRVGQIKNILYQFTDVGRKFSSLTSLHPDLKKYLLEKAPDIINGLPGHQEPEAGRKGWLRRERKYSPLLDNLFDKYSFRNQIYVKKLAKKVALRAAPLSFNYSFQTP